MFWKTGNLADHPELQKARPMPASAARIAANRRNAQKSTGPKSPEGKDRSRRNALKHGLTGQGVALPTEDKAEIERRFAALQRELKPSNELSEELVRRVAFMTVRIRRCEKHETSEIARRVRHAIAKFDDDRLASVETQAAKLYQEPATTVRRLQATPDGIDWLLKEWAILRSDLNHEDRNRWTTNHRSQFDALLGLNPGGYRVARIMALSEAVFGSFHHLEKADGEGLEGPDRVEWARAELTRLVDAEVARLNEVRARIDHEALAADRAEAVDRALFDASPESTLARKYEAAAERALYKALKEFRQVEADVAEGIESAVSPPEDEESEPVGSNLTEPEPEPAEAEPRAESVAPMVDFDPPGCSYLDFSVGIDPEMGPRTAETGEPDAA
jgi:hypothetical protein